MQLRLASARPLVMAVVIAISLVRPAFASFSLTQIYSFPVPTVFGGQVLAIGALETDGTNLLLQGSGFFTGRILQWTIATLSTDGALLATMAPFGRSQGLALQDGLLFRTDQPQGGSSITTAFLGIDPLTGSIVRTFPPPETNVFTALVSDGNQIYTTGVRFNTTDVPKMFVVDPTTGAILNSYVLPMLGPVNVGWFVESLAYSDQSLFVTTSMGDGVISEIDASTGVLLDTFDTGLINPAALAIIGDRMFVGDASSQTIVVYAITRGSPFTFEGFFPPVYNVPTENSSRAGAAVPVKFSLGSDQGLNIFADGFPTSQQIDCHSLTAAIDLSEETVAAGNSGLRYDAASNQYTYVWKTERAWASTCRQFTIKLTDGSIHFANFRFF